LGANFGERGEEGWSLGEGIYTGKAKKGTCPSRTEIYRETQIGEKRGGFPKIGEK